MKKIICLFCFSMFLLSCNDHADRISELENDLGMLENELENLREDAEKQQGIVLLLNASNEKKQIVSAKKEMASNTAVYWNISFADNTKIEIPESVIVSLALNESTNEYTITLFDGQVMKFNSREIIFPTGIVSLTQDIKFLKNTEVSIEFRVNPSNAIFNYDVNSEDCQIQFDMAEKASTYSYVTKPEKCKITRIEQAKGVDGKIKEGQYIAYILDNGGSDTYKYTTALVLSTQDRNGDAVQFSSSAISLARKKDSGLPVVVIKTENKAEILDKENWIPANMKIDGIGLFDDYEGTMTIRGRGNSTWSYPKKPYALKLDTKSEILGMPSHKRWVLLANYMDRTLMRNYLAFEISKRTELEWTVRGQHVEVVLNGIHIGNYYLCEQIKVDKNRVNIAEMASTDIDEVGITGGYLLELDRHYDEVNKFMSESFRLPVMLKEPEEDVLQPEQFDYIKNYINTFEKSLLGAKFTETRDYASYISIESFVDFWLVMEVTHNAEAGNPGSCYVYKDRSALLKAGPVWDFDWGTFIHAYDFCAINTLWYSQLFKDPVFVSIVKQRWNKFKPLFEEIVPLMEAEIVRLSISAELNDELWSLDNAVQVNGDETLSYIDATHNFVKRNYIERLKWLDENIRRL